MSESAPTSIIRLYLQSPSTTNSASNLQSSIAPYSSFAQLFDPFDNNIPDEKSPLSSTVENSLHLHSPSSDNALSSIKINSCDLKSTSTFYDNIEKLPTAFDSLKSKSGLILLRYHNQNEIEPVCLESPESRATETQYTSDANNSALGNKNLSQGTSDSNNSPFYSLSFKTLFGHISGRYKGSKNPEIDDESDLLDSNTGPHNLISGSPGEDSLTQNDQTFKEIFEIPETDKKEKMDPIYETYVRYFNQNQDQDHEKQTKEQDKEEEIEKETDFSNVFAGNFRTTDENQTILEYPKDFGDSQQFCNNCSKMKTQDHYVINTLKGRDYKEDTISSRKCNPGDLSRYLQENDDDEIMRSSTLRRLKVKTKSFLKNLTKNYDNEFKNLNSNKPNFKTDLKRRFSSSSMRRSPSLWNISGSYTSDLETESEGKEKDNIQQGLPHRWGRRGNSLDISRLTGSARSKSLNTGIESPSKVRSISDLFDSADYKERLKEGKINERKSYDKENDTGSTADDTYQVSYKYTDESRQLPQTRQRHFSNVFNFKRYQNQKLSLSTLNISRTERRNPLKSFLRKFGTSPSYYENVL